MSSSKETNHGVRKGTGRKKIKLEKIEKESNLLVTFSKRRSGIFKKANELSILCGAEVAIIVSSPSKKVYSYGSSSVDRIARRFVGVPTSLDMISDEARRAKQTQVFQLNEILAKLELEKKHAKELESKPRLDVNKMSLEVLKKLQDVVVDLQQEFDTYVQNGKNIKENHATSKNLNLREKNPHPKVEDRKSPVIRNMNGTIYRELLEGGKLLSLGMGSSGSSSNPVLNQSGLCFSGHNCPSPQFVDPNHSNPHFVGPSRTIRHFFGPSSLSPHLAGSSRPTPNFGNSNIGNPLSGSCESDVIPYNNANVHDDEATAHIF